MLKDEWPWPHFTRAEVSCRHCGELYPDGLEPAVSPDNANSGAAATQTPATQTDTIPPPATQTGATPADTIPPGSPHRADAIQPDQSAATPPSATPAPATPPSAIPPEAEHIRASLDALERLRALWGRPIVVTSGHRCKKHNRRVGGAPDSQHLRIAFDCACPSRLQNEFVRLARVAGFRGVGRYPNRNFVHLDLGPAREWTA